ncbi:threonine/serine exporter family protein [Rhodopila globiformis]|uniref:Threonine/serine exporter-like N-terminal domain-containing protein n=1 Tax=Rhodopila globiformis TaxID=1071 RepID=A0A2S6MZB8_RHOGL|nr:threonine/serine exporter family protein [Rhodopila globiformis]PPQ27723.1 hypothetical protein CCS01_26385 [Rhodopila globiformis]
MTLPAAPPIPDVHDPHHHRHRDLEQIAMACLACARMLMETGSRAMTVHECCRLLATGLGVEIMGTRVGYASITVTLVSGANTITRMVTVHRHGMDHRLNQAVRRLVVTAAQSAVPPADIMAQLDATVTTSPRHPLGVVVGAVGLACVAFGGLLGVDRLAFLPVFAASGAGQFVRHGLLARGINPYVAIVTTAFTAAFLCGTLARLAGSGTVNLAAIASTLLLVPGIPATNAQADILDGLPTMGSARAVSVLMVMVFTTTGIFAAQGVLGLLL